MNVLNQRINQIILVHHNEIPLVKIASGPNLLKIANTLQFNKKEVLQDGNTGNVLSIQLNLGLFSSEDDREIAIKKLVLEERRILIEVEGSSSDADQFFNKLKHLIDEIGENFSEDFLTPIIKSEESEIVLNLGFPISKLINPTYLEFVRSKIPQKAKMEYADTRVTPFTLTFQVDYDVKDTSISEHRIGLSRKEFSVQPAIGYPIDEQIYYSRAPFSTEVHLDILRELENFLQQTS